MTKLSAYWLMLFLYVGTAGSTMAQFEGIIESRNTTIDEAGQLQEFTMTMYIGPNMAMIRTSPFGSSPGSTMIYRGDMKVMWMLNEEDHTYFEIGHDEEPDRMFVPSDGSGKPDIKKTGKSKQVLGYKCDQIVIRESDRETEMWATKSLGKGQRGVVRAAQRPAVAGALFPSGLHRAACAQPLGDAAPGGDLWRPVSNGLVDPQGLRPRPQAARRRARAMPGRRS